VSAPKFAVGMRRIQPGFYVHEPTKSIHIDAVELCEDLGVPATPENQDTAEAAARRAIADMFPSFEFEVIHGNTRRYDGGAKTGKAGA
jgi:hypothetical protein